MSIADWILSEYKHLERGPPANTVCPDVRFYKLWVLVGPRALLDLSVYELQVKNEDQPSTCPIVNRF